VTLTLTLHTRLIAPGAPPCTPTPGAVTHRHSSGARARHRAHLHPLRAGPAHLGGHRALREDRPGQVQCAGDLVAAAEDTGAGVLVPGEAQFHMRPARERAGVRALDGYDIGRDAHGIPRGGPQGPRSRRGALEVTRLDRAG